VIAIERIGAEPGDADEVIAIRWDYQTAQRSQADRKRIQLIVEGVVEDAEQ